VTPLLLSASESDQGQKLMGDPSIPDKTGIRGIEKKKKPEFQLCFSFWEESG
jgi:hypothetical protein